MCLIRRVWLCLLLCGLFGAIVIILCFVAAEVGGGSSDFGHAQKDYGWEWRCGFWRWECG